MQAARAAFRAHEIDEDALRAAERAAWEDQTEAALRLAETLPGRAVTREVLRGLSAEAQESLRRAQSALRGDDDDFSGLAPARVGGAQGGGGYRADQSLGDAASATNLPMTGLNAAGNYTRRTDPDLKARAAKANDAKHKELLETAPPPGDADALTNWMRDLRGDDIRKLYVDGDPLWERIEAHIRAVRPEGAGRKDAQHEWFMVTSTADLVDIGFTVEDLLSFGSRTSTKGRYLRYPRGRYGLPPGRQARLDRRRFAHADETRVEKRMLALMHQEIAKAIDFERRKFDDNVAQGMDLMEARAEARSNVFVQVGDIADDWLADDAPWPSDFGER